MIDIVHLLVFGLLYLWGVLMVIERIRDWYGFEWFLAA